MKKISLWILMSVFAVSLAGAEETATQQQLDRLGGQIQDMQEAQALQAKKMDALQKEISELREKINTPVVNDSASRDDLKRLAQQVQEIDRKRQEDSVQISHQIEKLGATLAATPPTTHTPHSKPIVTEDPKPTTPPAAVPTNGYEYVVKPGDTLSVIIKAYRDKGVKVKKSQIIAANPKMNPDVLISGKTIFIPDAAAK